MASNLLQYRNLFLKEFLATVWMFCIFYTVPQYFPKHQAKTMHLVYFLLVILTGYVTKDAGMNPAISLALYAGSTIHFIDSLVCFLAQHLVSFFAVPMLFAIAPYIEKCAGGNVRLQVSELAPTIQTGVSTETAFLHEAGATALFTLAIMFTIHYERSYFKNPWITRTFVAVILRTINHFTGANMNPAIALAFIFNKKEDFNSESFRVFAIAPVVGALLGVAVWRISRLVVKSVNPRPPRKRVGKKW